MGRVSGARNEEVAREPHRGGPGEVLQSFEDLVGMLENQLWEKRREAEAERVQRHAEEWGGERKKTHYEFHGPEGASGDCSSVGQLWDLVPR